MFNSNRMRAAIDQIDTAVISHRRRLNELEDQLRAINKQARDDAEQIRNAVKALSQLVEGMALRMDALEKSDFSKNYDEYRRTMQDLQESNRGIALFPD